MSAHHLSDRSRAPGATSAADSGGADPATHDGLRASPAGPDGATRHAPPPAALAPSAGRGATSPAASDAPAQDGAAAWVRVRVIAPTGAVDVALPLARTVADLVDELLTSLLPAAPATPAGPWHLQRLGAPAFDPARPLAAACLVDGEVLHLVAGTAVAAADVVDDALVALAGGAGARGRWSTGSAVGVLTAAGLVLAAGSALLAGLCLPGGWVVALALAVALLVVARVSGDDAGDLLALASLPVWACAGLALAVRGPLGSAHGAGSGPGVRTGLLVLTVTCAATAVGSLAAVAAVPSRRAWWAGPGTGAALLAGAGALVTTGVLAPVRAAAVVAGVLVAVASGLAHLFSRSSLWSSDAPAGRSLAQLRARGRASRALFSALTAGTAVALGACAALLAATGGRSAVVLAGVVGVLVALRARRSRFVVESVALLVAGAAPLGALAARAGAASTGTRITVVAVVLAAMTAVLVVLVLAQRTAAARAGGAGADDAATRGPLARLTRPRVRRLLDVADAVLALAVLPLLGWVLGLYAAAADAGARW